MAKVIWRPLPGSQTFFMSCPADIILFHGSRGPGKRLINKAKLLTDSGWKEVGEVVLTDKLVAPDGTYTQILGIYPQESGAMYRMTFDDGCHIDCDGDHRWKVYNGKSMYWTVKTTNQLIGSKTFKHIPLIDKPVPGPKWQGYDPYIIGLMIGDGTMKGANPTIYNPEEPIKDYLVSKGWTCKKYPYRSVYQIYLNGKDEAKALIGAPIAKGDQKHVPAELLMADPNARLAVLQGLMDSDGHCDKEGRCEFKSVSEQLATNVQYLARSLGGKAKVHRQEITKPRLGERDHIFRVKITHAGKFVMFRLQRHIERLNRKQHGDKRRIVSIDKIEDAPATCFEVEHPSHLFVCQDFIVTHNTDAQLMRFFSRVGQGYGKFWRGVIFDREYKNLDDLIAKSERWFPEINPQSRFLRSAGDYKWKWPTGEELLFRAVSKPRDYYSYHGQEFAYIGWNELGKYPDPELFDAMMSCNRSSFIPKYEQKEIPLEIIATANPYGVGHNWIKKRFINVTRPGEIQRRSVKVFNPRNQKEEVFTRTQCHIFGSYKENIFLSPAYIVELESIQDPNKRKAWLKGSWDVTSGGMFDDIWERNIHVVEKFPIPKTWKIDRSFDWGASKPFSVGWWAESDGSDLTLPGGKTISTIKGDLYRIGEWYGTSGKTNQGVNMLAPDIAKGIIARERLLGIENRVQPGPADNSVFDSYNGNNIASEMESPIIMDGIVVPGVSWSRSDKKAGSRKVGWQKIRQYLSDAKPGKLKLNDGTVIYTPRNGPGLFIFSDCKHFIDLVPTLPRDEKDPDDVDCWVANTQISTLAGNIPIQNVRVGDYVHTPIGACMVTKSYCCKPSPVVKVFLENGVVLEGTPDHKIFVKDHGLVALGELECGAILPQRNSECLRLKRSFIKGLFIEDTRTGIITPQDKASLKGGVLHYIDKFTSIISGPFLKNTTSIIKTAIMKTIQRTAVTTKFCHLQSMPVCITRKEADSIIHGQEPRKGKEFFERMPTKCWKISRNENFRAEIVAELLRQNIPRKYIAPHVRPKRMQKDTARNRAKFAEQNSSLEDMQPGKSELAVIRVDGRCEEKATYNLTVKDAALFYANGILSSNTDAEDHIGDEARYRVLDSGRELSSGSIDGSH